MKRPTRQKAPGALPTVDTHPWVLEVGDPHPLVNPPKRYASLVRVKTDLLKRIDRFEQERAVYGKSGTPSLYLEVIRSRIQEMPIGDGEREMPCISRPVVVGFNDHWRVDEVIDESGARFKAVIKRAA